MTILAVDPGYRQSAWVAYAGGRILAHAIEPNDQLLVRLGETTGSAVLVIEEMQLFSSSYGVGKEIFDSVFWSGRFVQAWAPRRFERILRSKVRGHLGAMKGGDAAVRQALIDRYGPYKEDAVGRKSSPGPLFGIKADEWSALAIACVWSDLNAAPSGEKASA